MSFKHFHKNTAYGQTSQRINRDPMRKITGETFISIAPSMPPMRHEMLECGHAQLPPTDFTGSTYAAKRRRCAYCGAEQNKVK